MTNKALPYKNLVGVRVAMKLLIVSDGLFLHISIKPLLHHEPYEIVGEAHSLDEALSIFSKTAPDIVTLDFSDFEHEGIWCLRHMIAQRPSVKILVISAELDKKMYDQALKIGAKTVLEKPFTADTLQNSLRELVESA